MTLRIHLSLLFLALAAFVTSAQSAEALARGKPRPTAYTPSGPCTTGFKDGRAKDTSRKKRNIAYRLTYPKDFTGSAPVIIVSHGGSGDKNGHKSLEYLRLEYASRGYLVINLNHLKSKSIPEHIGDRAADVSFIITALTTGKIKPPAKYKGTMDLSRIGHAGHSWGSLTGIALAGGKMLQGTFTDPRISACAVLSPQGRNKYGTYDNGPTDNTWMDVTLPMFNLIGEGEVDGDCSPDEHYEDGWRLQPYERYPDHNPKYQAIVPEGCHASLAGYGTQDQLAYIAVNTSVFFDAYLKNEPFAEGEIGQKAWIDGVIFEKKP
jgi:pimeloyl-ACP methyl ester carboxylesterase